MQLRNESGAPLSCGAEPITLMLVGGGNRFPAFIGVLQAIEELKLNVTKVIASSTAAIVAGMYLCGRSPKSMLDKALSLDMQQFKDIGLKSLLTGYGLCSGERLEEWIDGECGGATFSTKMRIPLEIVATDMLHYRPVTFSADRFPDVKISTAAAATSFVPGVFGYKKLTHSGKKYALIDGSLMTGVVEGRLDRNQKVLVVKMMSKRTLKRAGSGHLSFSRYFHEMLTFSMHAQEKEFVKGGKWKDTIVIYCADVSPSTFSLATAERRFLYDQGYEQTKKYLQYKWNIQG